MNIQEKAPLESFNTFRIKTTARCLVVVSTLVELTKALDLAKAKNLPVVILGGGSNVIIKDNGILECIVIKIEIAGFEIIEDTDSHSLVKIGAGEAWDNVVSLSVTKGLGGIEALSAIPGTAGATPIQNVGAYGQEISDTLVHLEAYEISNGNICKLTHEDCKFGYRDSVFKNESRDRYIILSIVLKLSKSKPAIPQYPGLQNYFDANSITEPTLAQIRKAVIETRKAKLPDPAEIPSVGSFFKNPFISKKQSEVIKSTYPSAAIFPVDENTDKIAAGWLIDSLGIKGKVFGNLQIYDKNALVIVNNGNATYKELEELVSYIKDKVYEKFQINLEQEPVVIG